MRSLKGFSSKAAGLSRCPPKDHARSCSARNSWMQPTRHSIPPCELCPRPSDRANSLAGFKAEYQASAPGFVAREQLARKRGLRSAPLMHQRDYPIQSTQHQITALGNDYRHLVQGAAQVPTSRTPNEPSGGEYESDRSTRMRLRRGFAGVSPKKPTSLPLRILGTIKRAMMSDWIG